VTHSAGQFRSVGVLPERGRDDALGGRYDPLVDSPDLVAAARLAAVPRASLGSRRRLVAVGAAPSGRARTAAL
jgi:hypothetical protein